MRGEKIIWKPACVRCAYSLQLGKYPTAPGIFCKLNHGRVDKDDWCDDFKRKDITDERPQ